MSARRARVARSYRAAPLHPLRGGKLHAFAKAAQRSRPTARDLQAQVFETKFGIEVDGILRRMFENVAEGTMRHAFEKLAFGEAFIHAVDRSARGPANSVLTKAR
jgi:hypothetical protein